MQPGWNLGNTFDATGGETSWGNPVTTKELIGAIAAQGFKSIRIPVTWDKYIEKDSNYTIKDEFMYRIKEVVDWALIDGLYVMINMHHDSWLWLINMKTEHDEILKRYNAVWQRIASFFKDYPNMLMFESINEPTFTVGWDPVVDERDFELLDELNKSFFKIVKSSGGNNVTRPLVLPTIRCSPIEPHINHLYNTIKDLGDKNIIATVHYYGYYPFSVNVGGATRFDDTAKRDIEETFNRVYDSLWHMVFQLL